MRRVVIALLTFVTAAACERRESDVAPTARAAMQPAPAATKPVFDAYAGSQSCRECHEPAHTDWLKSNAL